mgnify:CR=1 FL=1
MSDIRANKISNESGNGPINLTGQSAAKAWVHFDGTAVTADADLTGVGNSLNISSVRDNGVGNYTVIYSNSMDSNWYSPSGWANGSGFSNAFATGGARPTTSELRMRINNSAFDYTDSNVVCLTINGDLA